MRQFIFTIVLIVASCLTAQAGVLAGNVQNSDGESLERGVLQILCIDPESEPLLPAIPTAPAGLEVGQAEVTTP